MIDCLIGGTLHAKPQARTGRNGQFATCTVRTPTRKDEVVFANVIAFSASAVAALLALNAGDSVAMCGEASIKTYTAKDGTVRAGIDLVVHVVLSVYAIQRKRAAVKKPTNSGERESASESVSEQLQSEAQPPQGVPDFDDDLPF
jgi:single-stranded DNA-binding protein